MFTVRMKMDETVLKVKSPLFVCLFSLLTFPLAYAEELPLWELGFGFGGLHQSYYVGTTQTRSQLFPIVLPIYRGDIFKSDDKGMRAEFFESDRYKFDVSADFRFAVDSDDIDLRKGMSDIGNILELGPSLEYTLSEGEFDKWFLKFPLRIASEFDGLHFSSAGFTFSPTLSLEKKFTGSSWELGSSVSLLYGDEKFNAIYYTVDTRDATFQRQAYQSDSGYAGSRFQFALTSRTNRNVMVFFVRYDNISGAVFEDSPLVETNNDLTFGVIYNRYFFKSTKRVYR